MALPDGAHRPVHVNSFIDPQKGASGVGAAAPVQGRTLRFLHVYLEQPCAAMAELAQGCCERSNNDAGGLELWALTCALQATWTRACTPPCKWSPARRLCPLSTRQVGGCCWAQPQRLASWSWWQAGCQTSPAMHGGLPTAFTCRHWQHRASAFSAQPVPAQTLLRPVAAQTR